MGSIGLNYLRSENPGLSDQQIAAKLADEHGYILVLRYKSSPDGDYNNLATCQTDEEAAASTNSPYCHDVEVLVDRRAQSLRITADLILMGSCQRCGRETTEASLTLMAGNDFYCCPQCATMFCENCYPHLPLTDGHQGYGMCPQCNQQVIRALPGQYGS